jgi:hypothetical protein
MLQANDARKWQGRSTVIWPWTSEGFLYIDVAQIYLWLLLLLLLLISPTYFNLNHKHKNEVYRKYELTLTKTCYRFHCDAAGGAHDVTIPVIENGELKKRLNSVNMLKCNVLTWHIQVTVTVKESAS